MKIFLIGMPGSGKTRIGRALANQLKVPFLDLDHEIEKETKKRIPEIFTVEGEDYFRKVEKDILQKANERTEQFVMATGGGAPCFFNSMTYMNKHGVTVFLNVPLNDLYQKLLKRGMSSRPLLKNKTPEELQIELQQKFIVRLPYYRRANIEVTTSFGVVGKRVAEIVSLLAGLEENAKT